MKPTIFAIAVALVTAAAVNLDRPNIDPGVARPARDPLPRRIQRGNVGILLIDAQPAFFRIMAGRRDPVEARMEQLLVFADLHQIPLIATFEHSPVLNGWLPKRLEKVFPKHGQPLVKKTFDCCREPTITAAIRGMGVEQIVVAGAETDVCVLQSVLGLREMGLDVFVLEDTVFTNESNPGPALRRMQQAGAIPSTFKTFYFEYVRSVARPKLSPGQRERRTRLRDVFKNPYALPKSGR